MQGLFSEVYPRTNELSQQKNLAPKNSVPLQYFLLSQKKVSPLILLKLTCLRRAVKQRSQQRDAVILYNEHSLSFQRITQLQ